VIPKPTFEGRVAEVRFYEEFFASDLRHLQHALIEACNSGLTAIDAIHIVAATDVGCEELVTTEKLGKPIHRTKLVAVSSIDAE
jgi:predicted nucleic acid-binding protein